MSLVHQQVLPLLTLYQFWATSVCRDVQWTIDCRVARLRALTDAGLLADAVRVFHGLMTGDRLPQPLTTDFKSTDLAAEPPSTVNFNTSLPLVEETNMMVCQCIFYFILFLKICSACTIHMIIILINYNS